MRWSERAVQVVQYIPITENSAKEFLASGHLCEAVIRARKASTGFTETSRHSNGKAEEKPQRHPSRTFLPGDQHQIRVRLKKQYPDPK